MSMNHGELAAPVVVVTNTEEQYSQQLLAEAFRTATEVASFERRVAPFSMFVGREGAWALGEHLHLSPETVSELVPIFSRAAADEAGMFKPCFRLPYAIPRRGGRAEAYSTAVSAAGPIAMKYLVPALHIIGAPHTQEEAREVLKATTIRDLMVLVAQSLGLSDEIVEQVINLPEEEIRNALLATVEPGSYRSEIIPTLSAEQLGVVGSRSIPERRSILETALALANSTWLVGQPLKALWGKARNRIFFTRDHSRITRGTFDAYPRLRKVLFLNTLQEHGLMGALARVAFELDKDVANITK